MKNFQRKKITLMASDQWGGPQEHERYYKRLTSPRDAEDIEVKVISKKKVS